MLEKYGSFVKDQIEHQATQAATASRRGDEKRAQAYTLRTAMFRQMLADMEEHAIEQSPPESVSESALRLSPEDIKDLPDELLAQLSLTEADRREFLIMDLIRELGGVTSIDKILVGLYRATGEIEKRTRLTARLYRMASKGMIHPVQERKGVYSLKPTGAPLEQDQDGDLFNEGDNN